MNYANKNTFNAVINVANEQNKDTKIPSYKKYRECPICKMTKNDYLPGTSL